MNRIRILTERVISMIAAGEVIERPASVVRELIDNSIDADARNISVEVKRGGQGLIKVIDDGSGMSRDDLLLSIERHATSKISDEKDLHFIRTMGFRGEALPSIGAVSRLTITSRTREELSANRLIMEGGVLKSIEETGAPPGTIVEVRNLFYNVPARKKFLKSVNTETSHIIDTFSRMVMPFHKIRFSLKTDGKTFLNLPTTPDLMKRISMVLGRDPASSMEEFGVEGNGFSIKGYISSPDFARSRPDRIYLYVNRRNVRDRMITRAIMEGYGQRLMKGTYPQVVILIEILPELVDVNVHPSKLEVRFRRPSSIYESILKGIKDIWGKRWTPAINMGEGDTIDVHQQIPFRVRDASSFYEGNRIPVQDSSLDPGFKTGEEDILDDEFKIIGQINNRYIVCETEECMVLVDQHAAHERIVYERLKNRKSGGARIQALLIPVHVELSAMDGVVLKEHINTLRELGIDIELFGGSSFIVRALPQEIASCDVNSLLNEIIPLLKEGASLKKEELMDGINKIMACHSSIRSGDRMSKEEMSALIRQLNKTRVPSNCPHGRPTFRRFSFKELDRLFKREL